LAFQGQLGLVYGQTGNPDLSVPTKVDHALFIDVTLNLTTPIKKRLTGVDVPDEVVARI
jgi:hypothetical protein